MKQSDQTGAWYSDNYRAAPRTAEKPRRRKKHTALKITMIVLCVLVLVVGSAAVLSGMDIRIRRVTDVGEPEQSDGSFGYSYNLPPADLDPGNYDSAEDFFKNFYTGDDTKTASDIERIDPAGDMTLTLVSDAGREELSLRDLYAKCIDSIVGIMAFPDSSTGYYWGTGVIMTADGYIVTNQHIISGTKRAVVILNDGTEYDALLVGEDTNTDLAVLKIDATGLKPAEFGDSAETAVGDEVIAIGNPLGAELTGTMTNGIISAINRDINMDGRSMTLLQTTAAINEGNSGGALINRFGQVIGVTNMKMGSYYSSVAVEGLGFAIPTVTVKSVVDQLVANGKVTGRPGIGITVGLIPDSAKTLYGYPDGLYISSVSKGSGAAGAGVRVGDILTEVNGRPVTTTQDVLDIRDTCAVGDEMTFKLWRDGKTLEITFTLDDLSDLY